MKWLYTALAALLFHTSLLAQQPEFSPLGSVAWGRDLLATLSYAPQSQDTIYRFHYLDQNYKQQGAYKTIEFTKAATLENFYQQLKQAFKPEHAPVNQVTQFNVSFQLGNKDVMLTNLKRHRDMQVIFTTSDGHVLGLTENQVDRLFGKE